MSINVNLVMNVYSVFSSSLLLLPLLLLMLLTAAVACYPLLIRITWAPFVGMFIAKISYGRTVRELFVSLMVVPTLWCIVWFGIWGGIALRQQRQAKEMEQLGINYYNDSTTFLVNGSKVCYHVPQDDIVIDGEVIFHNHHEGITPVCQFDDTNDSRALYNVLYSFSYPKVLKYGFGKVLSVLAILGMALFSITAYDSAALVMHYLSSNGKYLCACMYANHCHLLMYCVHFSIYLPLAIFVPYHPYTHSNDSFSLSLFIYIVIYI
jgi:choline-glycine betaine transporter